MRCPRDGQPLALASIDGCYVDLCPVCHGLWLDRGEMEQLFDIAREDAEAQIQVLATAAADPGPRTAGYMRCPRCLSGRLQGVTYTLENRVRIDRCETCLGIWLDSTELDAILEEKRRLDCEYSWHRILVANCAEET